MPCFFNLFFPALHRGCGIIAFDWGIDLLGRKEMWRRGLFAGLSLTVLLFSGSLAVTACPSADLSGDCFVGSEDFALLSGQGLNSYDYIKN